MDLPCPKRKRKGNNKIIVIKNNNNIKRFFFNYSYQQREVEKWTCPAISGAEPWMGSKRPGPYRCTESESTIISLEVERTRHGKILPKSKGPVKGSITSKYRFTEASRWKHSNASSKHRSFIRQNISKNVVCNNCIKLPHTNRRKLNEETTLYQSSKIKSGRGEWSSKP